MYWDALLPPALVLVGAGAFALAWWAALRVLRRLLSRPAWALSIVVASPLAGAAFVAVRADPPWRGGIAQQHLVAAVALVLVGAFAAAVVDERRWRAARRVDGYAHWRRHVRLR